tara:strand:+ start:380 stop:892 length:513 start_codon:yes stop_codon:yes gene_type:complete
MANVREYIRINPIDEQQDTAIGITIPFDGEAVFNSSYTTKEQVKSNLLNVLLTEPGERLFKPNFGVGIRNLLFEQGIDLEIIENKINSQVNLHIPEIILNEVSATQNDHTVVIKIFYQLTFSSENDSIQLNLNTSNPTNTGISTSNTSNISSGGGGASSGGGVSSGGGGY